jgi:hypothetical protein
MSRAWDESVAGGCKGKKTVLMVAETWRGPYRNLSWTTTCDGAFDTGEDPDLFRTKRGFHMLNHNTGPGSSVLMYSADGLHSWFPSSDDRRSLENAFNETIRWSNGTTSVVCRRQRPQVVFNTEDGMPGWFWSGVGDGPMGANCDNTPTWTLVQKIGRPADCPRLRL